MNSVLDRICSLLCHVVMIMEICFSLHYWDRFKEERNGSLRLNAVTLTPRTIRNGPPPPSHLPWLVNTKQLCSLMSASPVPGSPYIWACVESNSVMSVHLSKQRCQAFRVSATKLWSAGFPQPNRCQPCWEARRSGAVVKRAVRSHEKCVPSAYLNPQSAKDVWKVPLW